MLSTGEASGDAYGAELVTQLRRILGDRMPEVAALGGKRLAAVGVSMLGDTSRWGSIGIAQALAQVPIIAGSYARLKRHLRSGRPGLFVPIDFGYANIRLARHAKRLGWRVLYFVPPGSWRRDRQGRDLPAVTDAVVTPFPWSAEILTGMGANAHWFGHPIKQIVAATRDRYERPGERKFLAVLPGSRRHELDANLPLLAKVLRDWPGPALFGVAPSLNADDLRERWLSLTGRADMFGIEGSAAVLAQARAGLICSGTATLEAALCGCPMVVFYELTPSMRREVKLIRFKRPRFVSLPNILLDRTAVPEFACGVPLDPVAIRADLESIWSDSPERAAQLESLRELDELLGPADAITKTAELAAKMLGPDRSP